MTNLKAIFCAASVLVMFGCANSPSSPSALSTHEMGVNQINNWVNGEGNLVWRTGDGTLCWRDAFWTQATAVAYCEGAFKGLGPAAPAPMPAPRPMPTPLSAAPAVPVSIPAPLPATVDKQGEKLFPVWFGTNRNFTEHNKYVAFGNKDSESVNYGKAFVYVPQNLLELLQVNSLRNKFTDAVENNVKFRYAIPLNKAVFFSDLRDAIGKEDAGQRAVLVYLHGFATTFEQAAVRSAALGFALGMNTTAFFSWPSNGGANLIAYQGDSRTVGSSREVIAEFLIRIARESGAEKVHIVAHSMGNYGLFQAAIDPILRQAQSAGVKFGHIILAAPDVDTRTFAKDLKYVRDISEHVTMYVSSKDIALGLSKGMAGYPVVGLQTPPFAIPGLDTVDVTDTDLTFIGHSYVATDIYVLRDMLQLIAESKPPIQRQTLQQVGAYWRLLKE